MSREVAAGSRSRMTRVSSRMWSKRFMVGLMIARVGCLDRLRGRALPGSVTGSVTRTLRKLYAENANLAETPVSGGRLFGWHSDFLQADLSEPRLRASAGHVLTFSGLRC